MDHNMYTSGANHIIGSQHGQVDHDSWKETKQIVNQFIWTSNNGNQVLTEKYIPKNHSSAINAATGTNRINITVI